MCAKQCRTKPGNQLIYKSIFAFSLAILVTSSAFAFGGHGGSRKTSIYRGTGVDSIGVHIGGQKSCPENRVRVNGVCVCVDGYDDIDGDCLESCLAAETRDDNNNCVCNHNNGYYGSPGSCQLCDDDRKIIRNNQCVCDSQYDDINGTCYLKCNANETRDEGYNCICDNGEGYYGSAGSCQQCSGTGKIIQNNSCVCSSSYDTIGTTCYPKCNANETRDSNNNCICNNNNGYYGSAGSCQSCEGEGKIISDNQCVCDSEHDNIGGTCYPKCNDGETRDSGNNCICDNANGYYGSAGSCQQCSGTGKIINNNDCVCSSDYDTISGTCYLKCNTNEIRDTNNNCICDNSNGYYGDAGNCLSCEGENKVIKDNVCVCADGYEMYNNACVAKCTERQERDSNGMCSCSEEYTGDNCDECAEGYEIYDNDCVEKCVTGYYRNSEGVCQQVTASDYIEANVTGLGVVRRSKSSMTWWMANDWCKAQGMNLIDISKFECYRTGQTTLVIEGSAYAGGCCAKGQSCNYNENWYTNDNKLKYSNILRALVNAFGIGGYFWTASDYSSSNSSFAFGVHSEIGYVYYYSRSSNNGYALCANDNTTPTCPDGYTGDNCDECAEGYEKYNNACVTKCESTQYRDESGICQTCPSTLAAKNTEYVCLACTPGGYWTGSACKNPCAEGKFHISSGDCKACDPATYSTAAAATPAECALCGDQRKVFAVEDGNATTYYCAPKDCGEGKYHADTGTCRACSNYTSPSTVEECSVCAQYGYPRYIDSSDGNKCKLCPSDMASATSADSCEQCFGATFNNGVCGAVASVSGEDTDPCPAGISRSTRDGTCSICENGKVYLPYYSDPCQYSVTGCVSNDDCGEGYFCNLKASSCSSPTSGTCVAIGSVAHGTLTLNGQSQEIFTVVIKKVIGLQTIGVKPKENGCQV